MAPDFVENSPSFTFLFYETRQIPALLHIAWEITGIIGLINSIVTIAKLKLSVTLFSESEGREA